jgi:hypothetical protein
MAQPRNPDNQGEGNRDAARHYNAGVEKHARSGKVDEAARKAQQDLEGPEGEALRAAEKAGKQRMAEEDPELREVADVNDDDEGGPPVAPV